VCKIIINGLVLDAIVHEFGHDFLGVEHIGGVECVQKGVELGTGLERGQVVVCVSLDVPVVGVVLNHQYSATIALILESDTGLGLEDNCCQFVLICNELLF